LVLQYIKSKDIPLDQALYVSLDDIYFETRPLIHLAEAFYEEGGRYLLVDEVHKYPRWSTDLKLIYDSLPGLQVVATGSSTLNLLHGESDLSRRAGYYHLPGFSFREYLAFEGLGSHQRISLNELMNEHEAITPAITDQVEVLPAFDKYLQNGYYPFFREAPSQYASRQLAILNIVLETDVPAIYQIDYQTTHYLKKLLALISSSAPFQPNITDLGRETGIGRSTILKLLNMLDRASVIHLLRSSAKGASYFTKPAKIFLHNTNLMYALAAEKVNKGQLRETFLMNQLMTDYEVMAPRYGDFIVSDQRHSWVLEVGGPSRTAKQIKGVPNAYLAIDEIEHGGTNRIPLWLFGFFY